MTQSVSCTDIARVVSNLPHCCGSCHEDEELGYDTLSGGWWLETNNLRVSLCCSVGAYLSGLPDKGREVVQKALAAKEEFYDKSH